MPAWDIRPRFCGIQSFSPCSAIASIMRHFSRQSGGAVQVWRSRERGLLLLAPLYILGLTLAQMLVEVAGRYHYSMIPMLLLLGQGTWRRAGRNRNRRPLSRERPPISIFQGGWGWISSSFVPAGSPWPPSADFRCPHEYRSGLCSGFRVPTPPEACAHPHHSAA